MDFRNVINEYEYGFNNTTEKFKKFFGAMVLEEDFNAEHLELIQDLFSMLKLSNELIVAQAKTIQEIKVKVDTLLDDKTELG